MARPLRVHFTGALYHVLARGNRHQEIFHHPNDYQQYLDRLAEPILASCLAASIQYRIALGERAGEGETLGYDGGMLL